MTKGKARLIRQGVYKNYWGKTVHVKIIEIDRRRLVLIKHGQYLAVSRNLFPPVRKWKDEVEYETSFNDKKGLAKFEERYPELVPFIKKWERAPLWVFKY